MSAKRIHNIEGTSQEVFDYLESVVTSDKKSEQVLQVGCLFLCTAAVLTFYLLISEATHGALPLALLVIVLMVGAVLIYRGHSGDVNDARYESLHRLHRYLSTDCTPQTQYRYSLDLRPYTSKVFYSHKTRFGGFLSFPKGKFDYFQCPLLSAQLCLADGTKLMLMVDRMTRLRTRTKRRGLKFKIDYKRKYADTYTVKVKLPDGPPVTVTPPYDQNSPNRPFAATKYKQKSKGRYLTAIAVQKNTKSAINIEGLLQLLTSTFRQIHRQRSLAS